MPPQQALQSIRDDIIAQAEDVIKNPPPTTGSSRKKSLVFSNSVDCRLIRNLDDYSQREQRRIWYDELEYQVITNGILETISKMKKKVPEDDDNCYRGLEWKGEGAAAGRKDSRRRAKNAVFDEQEEQYMCMDFDDPEAIAVAYSAYTNHCKLEAFRRGIGDAKQVRRGDLLCKLEAVRRGIDDARQVRRGDLQMSPRPTKQKKSSFPVFPMLSESVVRFELVIR
jgi:hypothetical protein